MAEGAEPRVEKISIYMAKRLNGEPEIKGRPPIAVTFYFKDRLNGDEGIKYINSAYRGSWKDEEAPYKNRSICASCGPDGCKLKDFLNNSNNDSRWCFYFGRPRVESKDELRSVEIVNDQLTEDLAVIYIRQIIGKVLEKETEVKVSDESGYFPEYRAKETASERMAQKVRISLSEFGKTGAEAATA